MSLDTCEAVALNGPAAEVVAAVAALQAERDTLRGLLWEVLDHEHTGTGTVTADRVALVLLPPALTDRIHRALA